MSGDALYLNARGQATIPAGTITIRETLAPTGYTLNPEVKTVHFTARADGSVRSDAPNGVWNTENMTEDLSVLSAETPVKGAVRIRKTGESGLPMEGDASVEGVRFALINRSDHPCVYGGKTYAPGEVAAILVCDRDGIAGTQAGGLSFGSYEIAELRSDAEIVPGESYDGSANLGTSAFSNGAGLFYRANSARFSVTKDGETVTASESHVPLEFTNSITRGGVRIKKIDCETGKDRAQGAASLSGAEITIYNNSPYPVTVSGKEIVPGEAAAVLQTDDSGSASTAADLLPYGSYCLRETKAPEGYLLNTAWEKDFSIREEGEIVDLSEDPIPDDIKRADLSFSKIDTAGNPMPGIPFLIERLDENGKALEAHVAVTDAEGRVNTAQRPKTGEKVNCLDKCVSDGVFTDDSKLDSEAGIWFGEDLPEDNERGALLYANYRITEIRCAENSGHDMLMQVVFDEESLKNLDSIFPDSETVELAGIFMDREIRPESSFAVSETGEKTIVFGENVEFTDTIRYEALNSYNRYKADLEVWYTDDRGTAPKCLGTASKEFSPPVPDVGTVSGGTEKISISLSTEELLSGRLHAIDRFYVLHEDEWTELVSHNASLSDPGQMIFIPRMQTFASDAATGERQGALIRPEIIDTVSYENLEPGRTYLLRGELRDSKTGKLLRDSEGKDCVSEQLIRPFYGEGESREEEGILIIPNSGSVKMPAFTPDITEAAGKTVTVTEFLYDSETGEVILKHDDLSDTEQQVVFPDGRTMAQDAKTGTHLGVVGKTEKIIDTVTYQNLIAGQDYTLSGTLHYKEDFTDLNGIKHLAGDAVLSEDGKPARAFAHFTAEEPDGTRELQYDLSSELLAGASVVVFEELMYQGTVIFRHADLNDESQTLRYPSVRTSAVEKKSGEKTVLPDKKTVVEDCVFYDNLIPGEEYTLTGTLMIRETEETLKNPKGQAVSFSKIIQPEKSSGMEKIVFGEIDTTGLAGKTVVAFESLEYRGVIIARHEDFSDEAQSVHLLVPEKETAPETVKEKEPAVVVTDDPQHPIILLMILGASLTAVIVLIVLLKRIGKRK